MAGRGPRAVRAGVADGQKDCLPAAGGVAPVVRLQDERALGAVGNHEAVDNVVELATVATALVDVAHQLSRLTAVWGILAKEGSRREGTEKYVSTILLFSFYYCPTLVSHPQELLLLVLVITAAFIVFFVPSACLLIFSCTSLRFYSC